MNAVLDTVGAAEGRSIKERREIAYWVNDFLQDSDAILAVKGNSNIPWRIKCLAEMAFLDGVERRQRWGDLLYLHDDSTLKGGSK